jgi:hypothetical protein
VFNGPAGLPKKDRQGRVICLCGLRRLIPFLDNPDQLTLRYENESSETNYSDLSVLDPSPDTLFAQAQDFCRRWNSVPSFCNYH